MLNSDVAFVRERVKYLTDLHFGSGICITLSGFQLGKLQTLCSVDGPLAYSVGINNESSMY